MSTVASPLLLGGVRQHGLPVRSRNVNAVKAVANLVSSSLGPQGLDKMLVDDLGDVIVTNDGATILKRMELREPAAQVLVQLAQLQDQEAGDGTTSVVLISSELLSLADDLVRFQIHPTTIISGFKIACREACKYINTHLTKPTSDLPQAALLSVAKTALSSKLIGCEADFFAEMLVTACNSIKSPVMCNIRLVNILKCHGLSANESTLVQGYAINNTVACEAMPKRICNARIAILDFSLHKIKMKMNIQLIIEDTEQLEAMRQRETNIIAERLEKILAVGANVILTSGSIDDLCLKYIAKAGAMGVRRVSKGDLQRIALATGGKLVSCIVNFDGEEHFEKEWLGEASEVIQEMICDDQMLIFKSVPGRPAATIILRGANEYLLDEMERSVHDALCAVKRVIECQEVVAGGGAVEAALSITLENLAMILSSREQMAIAAFARALLIIPKMLAINAGLDAIDLVSQLRAFHSASQTNIEKSEMKWFGLNLENGTLQDCIQAGVVEPVVNKIKAIRFATEAAITILRIDDLIQLYPKEQNKGDKEGPNEGEDLVDKEN